MRRFYQLLLSTIESGLEIGQMKVKANGLSHVWHSAVIHVIVMSAWSTPASLVCGTTYCDCSKKSKLTVSLSYDTTNAAVSLMTGCRRVIHRLLTLTCNIVCQDLSMRHITTQSLSLITSRRTLQTFGMLLTTRKVCCYWSLAGCCASVCSRSLHVTATLLMSAVH